MAIVKKMSKIYILFENSTYKGVYESYMKAFKTFAESSENIPENWKSFQKEELEQILKNHNCNIVKDRIQRNYIVLPDYA